MAEGILKKFLAEKGINSVKVASAGIGTLDGYPATHNAVEVSARHEIDISDHHSTRMSERLFKECDLVFAMAREHHQQLEKMSGSDRKLFMLKAFPTSNQTDPEYSVEDPIGGSLEEYMVTFKEIYVAIEKSLPELLKRVEGRNENK
jgi:protein-tyrosine phosphatase